MSSRHTPATAEMLEAFLAELAAGKLTRKELHNDPLMPTRWQVHMACKSDERFAEQLQDAEIIGLEAMADDLIEIADTAVDKDSALAARVRLQARQWKLEKLLRNTYGRANEQGGEFVHYVVELPAQPASVEEWQKLYSNKQQNPLENGSASGVPNPVRSTH